MTREIWKPILWGFYAVSSHGRLKRLVGGCGATAGKILKPAIVGGYRQTTLHVRRIKYQRKVHTWVAEAFIGPRPFGLMPDHIDGNKLNNRATNLEYVTRKENAKRAAEMGLYQVGEEHWNSKLRKDDVAFIKEILRSVPRSAFWLSKVFGMESSAIYKIQKGITWRHIK